jgi:probable F420-dependent oxidoreductase
VKLGKLGIWTTVLDRHPAEVVREAASRIESMGYGAIWVGEAARREAFANSALLLSATSRVVVATGIANIWARDAMAMAAGQKTLAEAWGGRFLLGIGVSHDVLVNRRGHRYEHPLEAMRAYLDAMDAAPYDSPLPPEGSLVRVLAALGPKMLALAAERADGAHPYFVPVEHTSFARGALGKGPLLCPEVAVVVEPDPTRAREVARNYMTPYLRLVNYRRNLERFGYKEEDFQGGGSNRLVDAIVPWGDIDKVEARLREHFDAGADHVAVQVLTRDPSELPYETWEELARRIAVPTP